MNPWIKSGVGLIMRNAVRNGVKKRSGQEPCLKDVPMADIAAEAITTYLIELRYEIAWTSQKAYRMRATARGNEDQKASADILDAIAEETDRLIDECQSEQSRKIWGMF